MLTVTTAATVTRLADPAQVKTELGITDTSQDTYIGTLVDQASAALTSFCNRVFAQETVQETLRAQAREVPVRDEPILLSRAPVVSIASVAADGATLDGNTDFECDLAQGTLYRLDGNGEWAPWCARKVVVSYTAGFLLPLATGTGTALPADIERACALLAVAMYLAKGRDPSVASESVAGVGSQNYAGTQAVSGLPPQIEALARAYRLPASP